jgi:hypothetical protein
MPCDGALAGGSDCGCWTTAWLPEPDAPDDPLEPEDRLAPDEPLELEDGVGGE